MQFIDYIIIILNNQVTGGIKVRTNINAILKIYVNDQLKNNVHTIISLRSDSNLVVVPMCP